MIEEKVDLVLVLRRGIKNNSKVMIINGNKAVVACPKGLAGCNRGAVSSQPHYSSRDVQKWELEQALIDIH